MGDIVKRTRKLAEDLIALDLDMRLPPGTINPHLAADEIECLKSALRDDAERLRSAGERVGLATGCDTPDVMADEIIRLRAALASARNEALEEAAKIIDANCIMDTSNGKTLSPRQEGNRDALHYAAAIRKLKETGE